MSSTLESGLPVTLFTMRGLSLAFTLPSSMKNACPLHGWSVNWMLCIIPCFYGTLDVERIVFLNPYLPKTFANLFSHLYGSLSLPIACHVCCSPHFGRGGARTTLRQLCVDCSSAPYWDIWTKIGQHFSFKICNIIATVVNHEKAWQEEFLHGIWWLFPWYMALALHLVLWRFFGFDRNASIFYWDM